MAKRHAHLQEWLFQQFENTNTQATRNSVPPLDVAVPKKTNSEENENTFPKSTLEEIVSQLSENTDAQDSHERHSLPGTARAPRAELRSKGQHIFSHRK